MKVLTLQNKRFFNRPVERLTHFGRDENRKPLALIAEDHDDTRVLLSTLLKMWGFRTAETNNGRTAVELSARENPSIILMDIVLPGVDGLQAAQQIRQLEKTRNVPIVFITGYVGADIRLIAQACGGDEFLEKPFDLIQLQLTLAKYCPKLSKLQFA